MKNTSLTKISTLGLLFHGVIICLTVFSQLPVPPSYPRAVFAELLFGKTPFIPFGSPFSIFKPFLPPREKVSFITDIPFTPYAPNISWLYTAQSYLAPTILSHEPDQRAAIIYCSNTLVAQKRMDETGYRILLPLAEGKGIAVKK